MCWRKTIAGIAQSQRGGVVFCVEPKRCNGDFKDVGGWDVGENNLADDCKCNVSHCRGATTTTCADEAVASFTVACVHIGIERAANEGRWLEEDVVGLYARDDGAG